MFEVTANMSMAFGDNPDLLRMLNARMTMMEEICNSVPCDETPLARVVRSTLCRLPTWCS